MRSLHTSVLLGLTVAALPYEDESQPSFLRPRAVLKDQNSPRADDGGFLAKRANALSTKHFNARRATTPQGVSSNAAAALFDVDRRTARN